MANTSVEFARPEGHFTNGSVNSFLMVVATEIGDKTFFIAAVLAMSKHPLHVFAGCWGALATMTILSGFIGVLFPTFLSPAVSHYLAICLFAFFGSSALKDAYTQFASGTGAGVSDELEETEKELEDDSETKKATNSRQLMMSIFMMTFTAEWGDKSQIATVAMGAALDFFGVLVGAVVGHALCTGGAIVGGKMLSAKISERLVSLGSGFLFVFFAVWALISGLED